MSEYQYHEWQTIDRLLTPEEQQRVAQLSSHIEVTSSRAVVTYHWSNFRHKPKQVLLEYFDAYLYFANWGSVHLMFRFPKGLLDETAIAPYCDQEIVTIETVGKYQVLSLEFDPENGEYGEGWMLAEAGLSRLVGLRDDLLAGDYRLLYLAWLKAMTLYNTTYPNGYAYADEYEDERQIGDLEPPVPPGLKTLSPDLRHFIEAIELDPFLVEAAAERSEDLKPSREINYAWLVAQLPRAESDAFLIDIAEGKPGVALALRKKLADFLPTPVKPKPQAPRSVAHLLERAEQLQKAEQKRRAEAAHRKHIREMQDLAKREDQVWADIEHELAHGRRIASVYDEVTQQLLKLYQLAEYRNAPTAFQTRVRALAERYASRSALMRRWKQEGWL